MERQDVVSETRAVILRDFGLPADDGEGAGGPTVGSMDAVRILLMALLRELLEADPERLMHILYRVDVDEWRVRGVLDGSIEGDAAALLADLVIEREVRKVETRLRHRDESDEA